MKKLIAMVMTAAMVASLVPATAFAADAELLADKKTKIIDALELEEDFEHAYIQQTNIPGHVGYVDMTKGPEVQIYIDKLQGLKTNMGEVTFDVTYELDNAKWAPINISSSSQSIDLMDWKTGSDDLAIRQHLLDRISLDGTISTAISTNYKTTLDDAGWKNGTSTVGIDVKDYDEDFVTYTITIPDAAEVAEVTNLFKDSVLALDLAVVMEDTNVGDVATVSVETDIVDADAEDLVFITIVDEGITVSTKKTAVIAEEELNTLKADVKIKSAIGKFPSDQAFELKLSKGFEFDKVLDAADGSYEFVEKDGNVVYLIYTGADADEFKIKADDIKIEAVSAKAGSVCTMTVKAIRDYWDNSEFDGDLDDAISAKDTVELMSVVDYKVILSVDEDEEVPVIYSGVNVDNYGLTDDSDHMSLEVTAEETFPGAWSFRKGFTFELPEGVYVTDVEIKKVEGFLLTNQAASGDSSNVSKGQMEQAFFDAYQDGSHVNFDFKKRVFDDVDSTLNSKEAKVTFQLELVADPGFVGDVVLKLTGDLVDEQEATIAKFVAPYTVKAEQNDLIIDYRYTEIPTAVTLTEAEAGLWDKDEAVFWLVMDHASESFLEFEDALVSVDKDSDMEIDKDVTDGAIEIAIDAESEEAATVTVTDMSLFMSRSIPAGPYDLTIESTLADYYEAQPLFAPDCQTTYGQTCDCDYKYDWTAGSYIAECEYKDHECFVGDICDYSDVVKEAFVNVVTAGRDQDDASFTTKVVVPVGEKYIVAGEKQVDIDVPAYINAAGYTMLPVRAVATALGVSNESVQWNQATKTVVIYYGQRIITMQVGASVVYVNGAAIPASSSVEITNDRTFLGLRDLANALGVTDISWDAATKTATLNGGQTTAE